MSSATARARSLITPTGVFVALIPIALALIIYFGRDTTFWFDDWTWIEDRRPWTWAVFTHPHNDHLSIVPIAIYKLLFVTVGIGDYLPYRLVVAAFHALCATLVYLLVRRRAGAWPGVIAGTLILFLGSADQDLIWGFQIGFLGSIAGGLGAWLALERRDTRGDVVAALSLALAIGSSSLGVLIAAGIFLELLLDGGFWQRRLLVAAAPLALYAPWFAVYNNSRTWYDTVGHALRWAVDAAANAVGGLAGGGLDRGRVLGALLLVVVVVRVVRGWRPTPRAVGLVATGLLFYVLTAFARQELQAATTTRYIYLGAVLVVLLGAELVRDLRLPTWTLAAAGVLTAVVSVLNFQWLDDHAAEKRAVAGSERIELAAVELARNVVAPDYIPPYSFAHAGPYQAAVDELGSSPAVPRDQLPRLSLDGRRLVDETLQRVGEVKLSLTPHGRVGGVPPRVLSSSGGTARLTFGCAAIAADAGHTAQLWVAAGAHLRIVALTAPTEIRAARFGDGAPLTLGTASPHGRVDVVIAPDALTTPAWRIRLATRGRALACSLDG